VVVFDLQKLPLMQVKHEAALISEYLPIPHGTGTIRASALQ
jgi:hypothetical protein